MLIITLQRGGGRPEVAAMVLMLVVGRGVRDGHGSVLNIKLQVSDAGSGVLISQPLHLPLEIERSFRGDFLWK